MNGTGRDLKSIETWLDDQARLPDDPDERAFAERLRSARGSYRGLRYRGPAPELPETAGRSVGPSLAWMSAAAALLLAALLWAPGPTPSPAPAPGAWNPDTPSARLRALGEGLSAGLAKPERPAHFEFRLPRRPSRSGGFGTEGNDASPESAPGAESQG